MPKYRNVSGDTLWVDLGNGQIPKVDDGEVVDIPESDRYVQTGEHGEAPLFELVSTTPAKKSAPAEKE